MARKRRLIAPGIVLATMLVGAGLRLVIERQSIEGRYARIREGMTEAEVVAIMDKPPNPWESGLIMTIWDGELAYQQRREWNYPSGYVWVDFDERGNAVVSKSFHSYTGLEPPFWSLTGICATTRRVLNQAGY